MGLILMLVGITLFSPGYAQVVTFTADGEVGKHISSAFPIALGDFYSNLRRGSRRLQGDFSKEPLLEAGIDYDQPWTRDIAINSWNGSSFIAHEAVERTLLAVLEIDQHGDTLIGGQYWDNVIWVIGAWQHYLITGDQNFLKRAHTIGQRTMRLKELEEFDPEFGLFRGAAVYGDGVSAYDKRYTETGAYQGSEWNCTITKWVDHNPKDRIPTGGGLPMMTLSTNCVYFQAYKILAEMETALGLADLNAWMAKAEQLKSAINEHLWNESKGSYDYYIDQWSKNTYQEALGISFAVLMEIADPERSQLIMKNTHIEPAGIPCVWPSFPRYATNGHVGRHSGTVWGHIAGFWGHASASAGQLAYFSQSLDSLSSYFQRDQQCREIYHPKTSMPYGGLQEDGFQEKWIREWHSTYKQTWTATAYFRMVFYGLFGIKPQINTLEFEPNNYTGSKILELNGLKYGNATLNIRLVGFGSTIESLKLNGHKVQAIPRNLEGKNHVQIELKGHDILK